MKRFPAVPVLVAVVAVVYLGSFRGAFQFDDYNVIVENGGVHSWGAFLAGLPRGIRPLLKFSYTLNWTSGLGLFGFHLFNAALHAGNAVMAFLLASRILGPSASAFSTLFPALLFAVHPVQTEAVTYISGRSVSLMAAFYLGSLLAYLRGRERDSRFLLYVVSPALFLSAAAAKEVALTLPFALALCEASGTGVARAGWRKAAASQAVHWGLLAALAVLVLAHKGYGRMLESCFDIRGPAASLLTQVHGIGYLLSRLFLPNALNIDPDLPVFSGWSPVLFPETLLLAGLLAAGVFGLARRSPAGFGILWFFLQLVPTNSFIPRLDVANDRQLYLASLGIFLALGAAADRAGGMWGERRVMAAAVALLMLLAGFTATRNAVYRSEVALWEDTAGKSPGKARVRNNLGYAYRQAGRIDEARTAYLQALAIDPGYALARRNLEAIGPPAPTLEGPNR